MAIQRLDFEVQLDLAGQAGQTSTWRCAVRSEWYRWCTSEKFAFRPDSSCQFPHPISTLWSGALPTVLRCQAQELSTPETNAVGTLAECRLCGPRRALPEHLLSRLGILIEHLPGAVPWN